MTKDREALLYVIEHHKDFNFKKSNATYKSLLDLFCDGYTINGFGFDLFKILRQQKVKYKEINTAPRGGRKGDGIALKDKKSIEEIRLEKLEVINADKEKSIIDFKLECLHKYGKEKGILAIEYFDKFLNQEWKLCKEFDDYLVNYANTRNCKKYIHIDEPSHEIQANFNDVEYSDIFEESFDRYLLYRHHIINGVYERVEHRLPLWYERRLREQSEVPIPSFNSDDYSEIEFEGDCISIVDYSNLDFIPSGFKCEKHSGYCQYNGARLSYIVELWISNDINYQYLLKGKICQATYLNFDHPKSTSTSSSLLEACKEAVRWGSFYEMLQRQKERKRLEFEQREEAVAKWQEENGYPKLDSPVDVNTVFDRQTIEEEELNIPYYIRSIGSGALYGNDKIRKIHIPFSVDIIYSHAFQNMTNLEEVIIDAPVECIPEKCFEGCIKLSKITFHEGLKNINRDAFCGCISLEKIKLPNSCSHIAGWAFSECSNLKEVELSPDTIIDAEAFHNCLCENKRILSESWPASYYFDKKD